MEISASDWAMLSPLVDEALDLSPKARRTWLNESATVCALAAAHREQLQQLIEQSDAPETDELLATLPQFALKAHHYVDSFKASDVVGPYQLLEKVGVGGMSEVWRARRGDGAYEREVALKLPYAHASVASREHFIRRMERERDLLARLEHPNIARFYDAGIAKTELGAQPYIALEFVEGKTLIDHANDNRMTIEARCKLFLQVLSAVQYAHQRFVVHRDLKPSNILVRQNGQVALLDFGIAKVLDEETQIGDATMLTREMGRAITLAYASPEQLLSEPITTASDVYSAGVLFYELLCGKRPFAGHDHSMMSLLGVLDTPPPSITSVIRSAGDIELAQWGAQSKKSLTNSLSGDLAAITSKSLRRDVTRRYASASAFAEDLQRFLSDQPVQAREGARLYAFRKFLIRRRSLVLVSGLGLSIAVSLGAVSLSQMQISRENRARTESAEGLLSSMFDGMNADIAETRKFTAKELLDRAVASLSPSQTKSDQLLERIAATYENIGAHDGAIEIQKQRYQKFVNEDDALNELNTLTSLAHLHLQKNDLVQARRYLNLVDSHSLRSRSVPAKTALEIAFNRGWYAAQTKELDKAESEFGALEKILAKPTDGDPEHRHLWLSKYWSSRASVARQRRDYELAERSYSAAIENCEKIGKMCFTRALDLRVRLANVWMEQKRYRRVLETVPDLISEIERRHDLSNASNLQAHFVLSASQLAVGMTDDAVDTARKLSMLSKDFGVYRVLSKSLRVNAALYRESDSDILQEIDEWSTSSEFDVVEYMSASKRASLGSLWKVAHLLQKTKNEEAKKLLNNPLLVDSAKGGSEIWQLYMTAVADLRMGDVPASKTGFETVLQQAEKKHGRNDVFVLLAKVYLSLLGAGEQLTGDDRRLLTELLGWNRHLKLLLAEVDEPRKTMELRNLPFVYVTERS